jgi:pyruvate dehydrogenase E2 component (dihydrolipoamide acetyltransferase)
MATVVIMPKQGQSVESCIVSDFPRKKGDTVKKGDILFAYETDKASFEEESPVDGTVLDIFFSAGDEIPVLTNVLVIGAPGESTAEFTPAGGSSAPAAAPAAEPVKAAEAPKAAAAPAAAAPAPTTGESGGAVSPRARALADREAVNLSALPASGPKGRVIERDVQAAIDGRPKMTPLAKEIARETGAAPESGSGLAGMAKAADMAAPKTRCTAAIRRSNR